MSGADREERRRFFGAQRDHERVPESHGHVERRVRASQQRRRRQFSEGDYPARPVVDVVGYRDSPRSDDLRRRTSGHEAHRDDLRHRRTYGREAHQRGREFPAHDDAHRPDYPMRACAPPAGS